MNYLGWFNKQKHTSIPQVHSTNWQKWDDRMRKLYEAIKLALCICDMCACVLLVRKYLSLLCGVVWMNLCFNFIIFVWDEMYKYAYRIFLIIILFISHFSGISQRVLCYSSSLNWRVFRIIRTKINSKRHSTHALYEWSSKKEHKRGGRMKE